LLIIELDILNAKRELSLFDINELDIIAPFDGVVTEQLVSKGYYSLRNQSLLTFVSSDDEELDVLISNEYLDKINGRIQIHSHSRFGLLTTSLKSIIPMVDADKSMFHIRSKLPEYPWIYGETLRVEIQIAN